MQAPYLVVRSSYFYFSIKFVRWLYIPSEGHITARIDMLIAHIFFKLLSSLINFNFYPKLSDGDMYNQRYMSPQD